MADTNVFDPDEYPDLKTIHDRRSLRPTVERVYFSEGAMSQGADLNEAFSIEQDRRKAVGNLVARDGDRLSGADVTVDVDTGSVFVAAGSLYLLGSPRDLIAATLIAVPMAGEVKIGARMVETPVTAEDDALYLGLEPTAEESYGEPGAVRTVLSFVWAFDSDGGEGTFFPYITLKDGEIIAQDAPPTLSGVAQQIAIYDYDSHENYIVRGCQVSALGLQAGAQVFSIAAGVANILGVKLTRPVATRFTRVEDPDLGTVDAEPHTFDDGGTGTVTINIRRQPISAVISAIVTKQRTVTLTKGVTDGEDLLPDDGVSIILSVVQGVTTYVAGTDYAQSGDKVDWLPGGSEPSTGSSYQVTYRYLDAVTPSAVTATSITISGGVTGQPVLFGYKFKLPRYDRICVDQSGAISYLKGISAPTQPQPPQVPKTLLNLGLIQNDWFGGAPTVVNDGDIAVSVALQRKTINKLLDALNLITLQKQKLDINIRSAGQATGTFSDPLTSDYYRDAGASQNGAVFDGSFQVPILPTFKKVTAPSTLFLDFQHKTVLLQDLISECVKINPYQSFAPLPGVLAITPSQDFWTEQQTTWLSDQTRVFGTGNSERVVERDVISDTRTEAIRFLRQISVAFTVSNFGPGETLSALTFDGVDVNPGGLIANSSGVISGSFLIPANVTAGSKEVVAIGGSGARCAAIFTGQGRLELIQLRSVTTVERFQPTTITSIEIREPRSGESKHTDPQAQSFSLVEGRHISSLDLKFCTIGDRVQPVIVEFVTVENGFPTTQVIAQAMIDMQTVIVNQWTRFNFEVPFYLPSGSLFAFVVKTNDPDHSISAAERGQFDASKQQWIAGQPYTVGTRFSSSNAVSWTVHQDSDLTFRLNCAAFNPLSKIFDLGTFAVTNCSDVIIRGDIFLPTDDTKVVFELDFAGEPTVQLLPDQVWERTSFYTGNVAIRAILTGSTKVSPVVAKDMLAIFGTMQSNGIYISRSFDIGTAIEIHAVMSTKLPVGSGLSVEVDANDGAWVTVPQVLATPIDDGFIERSFKKDPYTAASGGRLRLTLTGTPAARPSIADLRAFTF